MLGIPTKNPENLGPCLRCQVLLSNAAIRCCCQIRLSDVVKKETRVIANDALQNR